MNASREFPPVEASESRAPEARERDLLARLPAVIARAQSSVGFASILRGVDAQHVTSREALSRLPVTRKSDLKALQDAHPPFGGLTATPTAGLSHWFMSPGPIFDPEGPGDDWWRFARALRAAGVCAGDVIHNCFSYHFTPGAWMVESGARRLKCPVIPAGVGQTELQLQAISSLRPKVYAGTPSFLKILIEKAVEAGADVSSIDTAFVSGEACPPTLEAWFRAHGVAHVFQCYASADLGLIAYQTTAREGLVVDESLIVEIVRPGSGDPVQAGEVGEVVVTMFNDDYPLIRFATGDLSAVLPGPSPCGRTNMRIKGWMGRADQTTKVRGMFVHPGQIDAVTKRFSEVARARLVVEGEMANDRMTLRIALREPSSNLADREALQSQIADALRDVTKLRGDIEFVDASALPNDGKVIEDARKYE